ncbi:MAG: GNAT family N-acetyltransferase [Sphingobacteriales bacterium]|nr:MAG: GNAT family N-acetyltransferase [Sphingobacteriales bacterium]
MTLQRFTTKLKDGTEVLAREATIHDAAEMIQCVKTYVAESKYMVVLPEEFSLTLHQGREWIQAFIEADNSLLMVAEVNGAIVGNLDITGAKRQRIMHNGMIGMGMLPDYRRKGLGSVLLKAGIDWATHNPYLQRLWLQVIAANQPAIELYKKFGFEQEGLQKNFIKTGEGTYADNLIMGLPLNKTA